MSKILSWIAAAQGKKKKKKHQDYWDIVESAGKRIPHHVKKRNALFDFSALRSPPPIEQDRLFSSRETCRRYSDGSKKRLDKDVSSMPSRQTRCNIDPKD